LIDLYGGGERLEAGKVIIVQLEDINPNVSDGDVVQFLGVSYLVIQKDYKDEKGSGVLLKRHYEDQNIGSQIKRVLFIKKDFVSEIAIGYCFDYFDIIFQVIDLDFKNENGTFIVAESIYGFDEDPLFKWETEWGITHNVTPEYTICNAIGMRQTENVIRILGFVINDSTGTAMGLSSHEAWRLVYYQGCTNARASKRSLGRCINFVIEANEGYPAFNSMYWLLEIPVEGEWNLPFPLSDKLRRIICKANY
jgi:hypothetical protein